MTPTQLAIQSALQYLETDVFSKDEQKKLLNIILEAYKEEKEINVKMILKILQ